MHDWLRVLSLVLPLDSQILLIDWAQDHHTLRSRSSGSALLAQKHRHQLKASTLLSVWLLNIHAPGVPGDLFGLCSPRLGLILFYEDLRHHGWTRGLHLGCTTFPTGVIGSMQLCLTVLSDATSVSFRNINCCCPSSGWESGNRNHISEFLITRLEHKYLSTFV
jgi:hypothetical protein